MPQRHQLAEPFINNEVGLLWQRSRDLNLRRDRAKARLASLASAASSTSESSSSGGAGSRDGPKEFYFKYWFWCSTYPRNDADYFQVELGSLPVVCKLLSVWVYHHEGFGRPDGRASLYTGEPQHGPSRRFATWPLRRLQVVRDVRTFLGYNGRFQWCRDQLVYPGAQPLSVWLRVWRWCYPFPLEHPDDPEHPLVRKLRGFRGRRLWPRGQMHVVVNYRAVDGYPD